MTDETFKGQTAVVTGASQGLGLAIAQRLHLKGANVSLWDIDNDRLPTAAAAFGETARVSTHRVDVTSETDVEAACKGTVKRWGRIDVLINNAGIGGPRQPMLEISMVDWQRVIDVNLTAVFLCCRAVSPGMVRNGYGRIVNIASIAGKEASPTIAPYSASKHAVIGLTKTLGRELATSGVTVNAIAPAAIETALTDAWPRDHVEDLKSKIPMRRFGRPEELAALVAWVASPEASFNTGAVFDLSGGRANF